jgi:hypothetical protein
MTAAHRPLGTWRNRILGSGEEAPDQLAANPRNWRIHPAAHETDPRDGQRWHDHSAPA